SHQEPPLPPSAEPTWVCLRGSPTSMPPPTSLGGRSLQWTVMGPQVLPREKPWVLQTGNGELGRKQKRESVPNYFWGQRSVREEGLRRKTGPCEEDLFRKDQRQLVESQDLGAQ
ncbi:hypothetical protein P7K49_024397, partial [Saguinus oedipus]